MNQRANVSSTLEDSVEEVVSTLFDLRARFDSRREWLRTQMDTVDRQIEALEFLIDSVTEGSERTIVGHTIPSDEDTEGSVAELCGVDNSNSPAGPVSGVATVQDIMHCGTQREAARVIAEINGGYIDLKSAAPVIEAARLSKGMLNTIVSSLHNWMSNSGDWVYSGPSKFRLIAGQKAESKANDKPSSVFEKSGETRGAVGGTLIVNEINDTAA